MTYYLIGAYILLIGLFLLFFIRLSREYKRDIELKEQELSCLEDKYEEEGRVSRQTEQALIKSEERYRALFDNNPIQTIVVDNSCRIVMYNFARTKVEGRLPVIGATMYKDYAMHHDIDMFKVLQDCIEQGCQKELVELKYREKYLHIHISPFTAGAIITSIDVTATKNLFDQLQHSHKIEAVGTLAGGVAHEFNNILGIIIGNVELASDEMQEVNSIHDHLVEIKSASLRAKDVVRQLLSFSRQKNRVKIPVNIGDVIEEWISLIRASTPTSIEIYSSIQKDIPMVMADPMQVQQVLINLCTNSAHAMEDERGTIQIKLQEISLKDDRIDEFSHMNPGNYVLLSVKDNGKGIENSIKEKIFNPYFTTKDVGKGTGMGLAMVDAIIIDHGGKIILNTEVNVGTTIQILFPTLTH